MPGKEEWVLASSARVSRLSVSCDYVSYAIYFFCCQGQKHFWKTINFVENLKMTHKIEGGQFMLLVPLSRITYENRYVTHPHCIVSECLFAW